MAICRYPKGVRANAVLYIIVETARANELDVYEYLKYLLEEMPNSDYLPLREGKHQEAIQTINPSRISIIRRLN